MQAVQRHQRGHEDGDRQDHVDQLRHVEERDLQEDQRALPLVDDQVEARKALAQHCERRQRQGGEQHGAKQLAEQVSVDQAHR